MKIKFHIPSLDLFVGFNQNNISLSLMNIIIKWLDINAAMEDLYILL